MRPGIRLRIHQNQQGLQRRRCLQDSERGNVPLEKTPWLESAIFETTRSSWRRGPSDVGIGDDFLVLMLIVASGEEPRLGMTNRWRKRYAMKAKMTSLGGVARKIQI